MIVSKSYLRVCDRGGLTPTAKLVAMRLTACATSQENGHEIALVFQHTLMHWVGCTRAQLVSALEELKADDTIKSFRWVQVSDADEGGRPYPAVLAFIAQVDVEQFDLIEEEAPTTEDIVDGDTSGITRIDPRRARIFAKTDGKCFYCVHENAAHLDHMQPSSRGGSDEDSNMIGACAACNIQKKDRTVAEYRAWISYKLKTDVSQVLFHGERAA